MKPRTQAPLAPTRSARSHAWARYAAGLLLAFAVSACSEETDGPGEKGGPEACLPPSRLVDGACREPGVQDDGCPAGAYRAPDTSCQPAGIPAEACAAGFVPTDERGCEPILPPAPCPAGLMALPGEAECREIMPCGAGRWGDIPVDATTMYVDQSYDQGAGPSDGTEARPYTTVGQAVEAAPAGALVAIAQGSYVEDVVLLGKVLRLWGTCPAQVELVGTGGAQATVRILTGSSGSELAGLAIRGPSIGVLVMAAENLHLHGLWIHDNAARGIDIQRPLGPSSASISASLIEHNHEHGVYAAGADVALDGVVVRGTSGRGLTIGGHPDATARPVASLRASLIEHSQDIGILVTATDADLEAVVVRDTSPEPSNLTFGWGLVFQEDSDTDTRASAAVRTSLISRSHEVGLVVLGSDAELDAVVVRVTLPNAFNQQYGRGIHIQDDPDTGNRSSVTLRASLVDQNHEVGVVVSGSDAEIEGVVVRDTLPQASDLTQGLGIAVHVHHVTGARASAVVRGSLFERNYDNGVIVVGADAQLVGASIVETMARQSNNSFGDGVVAWSHTADAMVELSSCNVDRSARAGLAVFGAAASIDATALSCNSFHLARETYHGLSAELTDAGYNRCSCGGAEDPCTALSIGLEPPEPIDAAP